MKGSFAARIVLAGVVGFSLPIPQAYAAATDSLIEGAKLCTRHLSRFERAYGVPTHLLSAIASTESGRFHQGLKISVPWPWTINAEGKGYYFESKAEAVAMAKKLRSRGVKSMDVGCMQVNLHHHADAFSSLEQAFEPENNIAYAANFLRTLYEDTHSWKQAASDYHSKTPEFGKKYVGRVFTSWYEIVDRLRLARMNAPTTQEVAAIQNEPAPQYRAVAAPRTASAPKQQVASASSAPHMKVISLSKKPARTDQGILVIKPDVKVVDEAAPVQVASAAGATKSKESDPFVLAQAKPVADTPSVPDAKVVRVGDSGPKKNAPRFIFSD